MSVLAGAAEVWREVEPKIPPNRQVDVAKEVRHVLNYLAENVPELYRGMPVPKMTEDEIIAVTRSLSHNATEACVQVRFYFLAKGIEIGNVRHGWKVPLIPHLVRIKKPANWATLGNFAGRTVARKVEHAFGVDLELPPSPDPAVQYGQLLFSAIFFGCLLEIVWLEPFLSAVTQGQVFQHKGVLWVEMVRKNSPGPLDDALVEDEASFYTKRFFPDHFTLALLYRVLDNDLLPATLPANRPWELLQTYLKQLSGLSLSDLPKSLTEFRKLSISRNLLLPGSVLAYATGQLKATSLAIGPWLRCLTGKAFKVARPEPPGESLMASMPKLKVHLSYNAKLQEKLFKMLLKDLNPKGKIFTQKEPQVLLDKFLANHKAEISPTFHLLLLWGKQLQQERISYLERRIKKKPVEASTLHRYFQAVNVSLLHAASHQNLLEIDPQEVELIYEEAIDNRPEDAMAPQCLSQFHGFLQAFFGRPPIESIELKGQSSSQTNENANLITLDLYQLILEGLGWGRKTLNRWQKLRIMGWIICYRCGLRPSEVLNLRTIDFQLVGPDSFELLIRIKTKTERGIRRVPAALRMSGPEISFLLSYYQQRCTEMGFFGGDHFLAHPDHKSGCIEDGDLFGEARTLLKTVSKDDTLRLYHARHTFNTSLQVQFQLRGLAPFNRKGFLNLDISCENDALLRKTTMGTEVWGRKDQYVQGILVGHATPEVTNLYYNHLSDLLLGCQVRRGRDRVPVSLKTIMALSGLNHSRANELLGEGDHPLARLVASCAKRHADRLTHPLLNDAELLVLPRITDVISGKLPPWSEVLTEDVGLMLKRGERNWEVATQFYEGVSHLGGKRFNTAMTLIRAVNSQLTTPGKRWRGPTYASITELRTVLVLFKEIGITDNMILLIHHPRRGQENSEQAMGLRQWQERIGTKLKWSMGEMANADSPKRGLMEMRIINAGTRETANNKHPAMSRGFEIAVQLLSGIQFHAL